MNTNIINKCKAYTSLEQSKKLAEILPLESADMTLVSLFELDNVTPKHCATLIPYTIFSGIGVPCWSLTALLNYIKDKCGYFELVYLSSTYDGRANKLKNVYRLSIDLHDVYEEEVIDACVKMIVWLKENNKL